MARPREDDRDAENGARANAAPTDAYPGVPGATKAEVDAFLAALDDFQPVVRRATTTTTTTTRRRERDRWDDDATTKRDETRRRRRD